MITVLALIAAVELGLIYAILALGVFLSFRTLNTPDLTVDGSLVTGAATAAVLITTGFNPILASLASFLAGALGGAVTAFLNTKLKIQPLLAGILVMLGLYSINMHIMGGKANIALLQSDSIYKMSEKFFPKHTPLIVGIIILVIIVVLFFLFLKTRIGLALRATGDNEDMVKAYGVSSDAMRLLGLSLSNGFAGLSGGLLAQYQAFVDISMGVGMVVIGLASVIIGEVIFGTKTLIRRLFAVSAGAILYRLAISFAIAWGMNPMDLKLISAIIVVVALSFGVLGGRLPFRKGGLKSVKN